MTPLYGSLPEIHTDPHPSLFHNDATEDDNFDINDLADLTPQCGRKGDALKLFLTWAYYGTLGLSEKIGQAFERAEQLYSILESDKDIVLVSSRPLPCLQVSTTCLYTFIRPRPRSHPRPRLRPHLH